MMTLDSKANNRFRTQYVKKKGTGCWLWVGRTSEGRRGSLYPRFSYQGKDWRAHRLAHELYIGPIPEGFHVDHLCKNTLCINPQHLEAVHYYVNIKRSNGKCAKYMTRTNLGG